MFSYHVKTPIKQYNDDMMEYSDSEHHVCTNIRDNFRRASLRPVIHNNVII